MHSLGYLINHIEPSSVNDVFTEELVAKINELIAHDFPALVQLLYRIDIHESKLKQLIAVQQGADAGRIIARLIIERQLEKAKIKKQFKRDPDIDEGDKW